jgi:RNA polymerase sigma-70 factor, ECF subfamily
MISRILAGDRDLYAELVKANQSRLYQLCLAYLGDPNDAEEAAHMVFIKAYAALPRFRGDAAFGTWLFRIGINQCKDILKMRRRSRTNSLDDLLGTTNRLPSALVQNVSTPDPEMSVRLNSAMKKLSRGERVVLNRVAENPTVDYGVLGKEMGLSRESVKSHLKRARAKILGFLRKHHA